MSAIKPKGPIIDPGKCRCCGDMKKCRVLNVEYTHMGQKEVYSDMMLDCFGLLLSHLDGGEIDRLICATCVVRLREANTFRKQVLNCEELLLRRFNSDNMEVKTEADLDDDVFDEGVMNHDEDINVHGEDKPHIIDLKQEMNEIKTDSSADKNPPKQHLKMKNDLLKHMSNLKSVVENKKTITPKVIKEKNKRARLPTPPPPRLSMREEDMIYENTLTIIENSYVCPFNNKKNYYYCFYCKSIFLDPNELRRHTLTHEPILFERFWVKKRIPKIDITRIDCRLCNAKIDTLHEYRIHVSKEHKKEVFPVTNEFLTFRLTQTDIPCLECNETFLFIDKLLEHMTEHFGKYICDVCGNNFLQFETLKAHLLWHKKADEDYPCHICGKILKSSYTRNFHIQVVHKKKASIECFKCDEKFLSYQRRNKHLVEAHGEMASFSCSLCGKSFETRRKYGVHFRKYHSQECPAKSVERKRLAAKQKCLEPGISYNTDQRYT